MAFIASLDATKLFVTLFASRSTTLTILSQDAVNIILLARLIVATATGSANLNTASQAPDFIFHYRTVQSFAEENMKSLSVDVIWLILLVWPINGLFSCPESISHEQMSPSS